MSKEGSEGYLKGRGIMYEWKRFQWFVWLYGLGKDGKGWCECCVAGFLWTSGGGEPKGRKATVLSVSSPETLAQWDMVYGHTGLKFSIREEGVVCDGRWWNSVLSVFLSPHRNRAAAKRVSTQWGHIFWTLAIGWPSDKILMPGIWQACTTALEFWDVLSVHLPSPCWQGPVHYCILTSSIAWGHLLGIKEEEFEWNLDLWSPTWRQTLLFSSTDGMAPAFQEETNSIMMCASW